MEHEIEIRIHVVTSGDVTTEEWEEYIENLLSKLRAGHDWNSHNRFKNFSLEVRTDKKKQEI